MQKLDIAAVLEIATHFVYLVADLTPPGAGFNLVVIVVPSTVAIKVVAVWAILTERVAAAVKLAI